MFSITGEAASCNLYSHGAGCPISANAAPGSSDIAATVNPVKQAPNRPFDIFMSFALPSELPPQRVGPGPRATLIHAPDVGLEADL
jgi:hypothetical protein